MHRLLSYSALASPRASWSSRYETRQLLSPVPGPSPSTAATTVLCSSVDFRAPCFDSGETPKLTSAFDQQRRSSGAPCAHTLAPPPAPPIASLARATGGPSRLAVCAGTGPLLNFFQRTCLRSPRKRPRRVFEANRSRILASLLV